MTSKKIVYVPSGPSDIKCACGTNVEMKNTISSEANEASQAGVCKSCGAEFVTSKAIAGDSPFSKVVYLTHTHHVHCACGGHVHMDQYTLPGSGEPVEIGYCVPCGIEYRSM